MQEKMYLVINRCIEPLIIKQCFHFFQQILEVNLLIPSLSYSVKCGNNIPPHEQFVENDTFKVSSEYGQNQNSIKKGIAS